MLDHCNPGGYCGRCRSTRDQALLAVVAVHVDLDMTFLSQRQFALACFVYQWISSDTGLNTTDGTCAMACRVPHLASRQQADSDRSIVGNVIGEGARIHQGDVYYPGQRDFICSGP